MVKKVRRSVDSLFRQGTMRLYRSLGGATSMAVAARAARLSYNYSCVVAGRWRGDGLVQREGAVWSYTALGRKVLKILDEIEGVRNG